MIFAVHVEVLRREGIADPEAATIERAMPALGFDGFGGLRVGKSFRFTVEAADQAVAESRVDELCQRLLTNPVIENAAFTVAATSPGPANSP